MSPYPPSGALPSLKIAQRPGESTWLGRLRCRDHGHTGAAGIVEHVTGADGRDDFATAVRASQTRRRSLLLRRTGPSRQTYFQPLTGEEFFQHEFPHERSDLSHWRKRLGGKPEGPMRLTETADRPRSDALKDVRASHPYHATIRADICRDPSRNNGRRADEASRPYRRYSAIRRPIPRCLEHQPRTLNAPNHIIRDCRTWTHWAAEENSGEISGSWVDRQNFQD